MPVDGSDVVCLLDEVDKLRAHVGVNYLTLLHQVGETADVVRQRLERQKTGMPSGYRFGVVTCPDCGQRVAENWIIRHMKSGCTMGGESGGSVET